MFNKLQRVGLRNNTHIHREFTRERIGRKCCGARSDDTFFFYYTSGVVLFLSLLIIVYRSHACAAYCVRKGTERMGREDGLPLPRLSCTFSRRSPLASQSLHHSVCSCAFEFNKIRNCGLQWRRNALFAQCVFLCFFFLFLNVYCSISSDISLLLTRIFMAVTVRYLWSRLCNHRI